LTRGAGFPACFSMHLLAAGGRLESLPHDRKPAPRLTRESFAHPLLAARRYPAVVLHRGVDVEKIPVSLAEGFEHGGIEVSALLLLDHPAGPFGDRRRPCTPGPRSWRRTRRRRRRSAPTTGSPPPAARRDSRRRPTARGASGRFRPPCGGSWRIPTARPLAAGRRRRSRCAVSSRRTLSA